ncbi:hypothetical protein ACFPIJ_40145 [Dactylosporangium cerinum]|uniref:Uncharacterized protein n=1 Tax=Dactylosporangium cerinum TaxID=1434730 RepID=A0ABV9W8F2_9ACTN
MSPIATPAEVGDRQLPGASAAGAARRARRSPSAEFPARTATAPASGSAATIQVEIPVPVS